VKRLQPGEILDVPESKLTFDHDCFTLGGNAGSPIIDIESQRAIGLHFAGRYLGYKRGTAVALWKLRDHPLLLQATL
jgi:V8-like Glu-specific endopeptidase